MEDEMLCTNCIYFRQHYALNDDGLYYELNNCDCTQPYIGKRSFAGFYNAKKACVKWKHAEHNVIPKENIYNTIEKMATRIEQIAKHLKID